MKDAVTRKKFFFIPAVRPNTKVWLSTSTPAAVWIKTTIARSAAAGVQVCCAWHTAQGGHCCARTEPSSRPQKICAHERCCECRRWTSLTRRGRLTSRAMVTSLTSVVWRVPSARRIMPRYVARQRRRTVAKPIYAPASLTRATDDLHTRRRTHCLALTPSCTACRRPERRHSGVAVGQPAEQRQLELLQLLPAGAVGGNAVVHCVTQHPDTSRGVSVVHRVLLLAYPPTPFCRSLPRADQVGGRRLSTLSCMDGQTLLGSCPTFCVSSSAGEQHQRRAVQPAVHAVHHRHHRQPAGGVAG